MPPRERAARIRRRSRITAASSLAPLHDALVAGRGGADVPCCRDLSGRPETAAWQAGVVAGSA